MEQARSHTRDVAVVVRHHDGSFTINRESLPAGSNILGGSLVGLLAGLVVGAPLTGAALGAVDGRHTAQDTRPRRNRLED